MCWSNTIQVNRNCAWQYGWGKGGRSRCVNFTRLTRIVYLNNLCDDNRVFFFFDYETLLAPQIFGYFLKVVHVRAGVPCCVDLQNFSRKFSQFFCWNFQGLCRILVFRLLTDNNIRCTSEKRVETFNNFSRWKMCVLAVTTYERCSD